MHYLTVLSTQAASGIGKETAFIFAEAGAAGVLFADIKETEAKDAAEASKALATNQGYRAFGVKVDITDTASVQSMVDYAVKKFGRVDYCVNSAGVRICVLRSTSSIAFSRSCGILC